MKRYVIGDIHGRFEALQEVLAKADFDYQNDKLILLGDLVDGGPRTWEVVEELLKIKNIVYIIGNHDNWFMDHMASGWTEDIWVKQGGQATLDSYKSRIKSHYRNYPVTHIEFFARGKYYHIEDNMVFTHGGFNPSVPLVNQEVSIFYWDRQLLDFARSHKVWFNDVEKHDPIDRNVFWDKVFIGHSTTTSLGTTDPIKRNNLWMLDTGAGNLGRLTIMDVDTEEYWQSELQPTCMTR